MKLEIVEKLVVNLHDKTAYVVHIKNLKPELNHGLILEKVHRVIQFNSKPWLKPDIDMNTNLRQKAKTSFGKYFFNLMNNAVFGKPLGKVKKHRDIKLITGERGKIFSFRTKLSYGKVFHKKFIRNRNEKSSNINE